ncbi:MAG TPA: PilZ domain-containing protein [Sphingomicrobium sp.]|nr:PilZ domain-containing protein [Sphingomicrobium sp.]
MDQTPVMQNRRHRRSNVMLKATLETPGGSLAVTLRNLSQDGALIRGEDLPEAGSRVLFHRDGLSVPSRVAWSHCGHAGLAFDFPLYPKEMLRHVPEPQPRPEIPIKRRPGLSCKPLTAAERAMIERWATEGNPLGE